MTVQTKKSHEQNRDGVPTWWCSTITLKETLKGSVLTAAERGSRVTVRSADVHFHGADRLKECGHLLGTDTPSLAGKSGNGMKPSDWTNPYKKGSISKTIATIFYLASTPIMKRNNYQRVGFKPSIKGSMSFIFGWKNFIKMASQLPLKF